MGKKKQGVAGQLNDSNMKQTNSPKAIDEDMEVFISMSQELKEEGNKLFQRRDLEGAMLKYEKAIKLLPKNHIDVSYLRSNMAACYMQMGLTEYPRAIQECNLALENTPKYSKALLKRAKCYEALNRLDLALRDVNTVLKMEPNNIMALEVRERVKYAIEEKGLKVNDTVIELPPEFVESPVASDKPKVVKEKVKKKKSKKAEEKKTGDEIEEKKVDSQFEVRKTEDKVVVKEKISRPKEVVPKKNVKLVFGEDIRCVQLPLKCSIQHLREVVSNRFPGLGEVLIKYRDQEGDLVTITSDEELRWAEAAGESQGSLRLYLVDINSQKNSSFERLKEVEGDKLDKKRDFSVVNGTVEEENTTGNGSCHIDEWILEFAEVFKYHVGFDSDTYLRLHELGMKVYSEAMEDTITSEEAQGLFDAAARKFQEMAALAMFNWGNVHMSRARKRIHITEDASREAVLEQIRTAYDWAREEYTEAGRRYELALEIKPDFYEGLLALGQQQFELAKLSWYYAIGTTDHLETWSSEEVIQLYNSAEDNIERGTEMWEELEAQRQSELANAVTLKSESHKKGSDRLYRPADESIEQAKNLRSQINLLWGTVLYERSMMEFKLGLPVWPECLEVALEKFQLAGASPSEIAVMIKNHVSNFNAVDGLGFKIDEIVLAWNEIYEAKKLQKGIPSFRLEPVLRRRVSKIYHALEFV